MTEKLPPKLTPLAASIQTLKKGYKNGTFYSSVTSFPPHLWLLFDSVLRKDTGRAIPFTEIAKNLGDLEYIKELKSYACQGAKITFINEDTGDKICVHRSLLTLFPADEEKEEEK